jgi:hypothetical protein
MFRKRLKTSPFLEAQKRELWERWFFHVVNFQKWAFYISQKFKDLLENEA